MNGCCADKACTATTCMALPAGTTCGDCRHMRHCAAFYGHQPADTTCDFFPRRFVAAPKPAPQPAADTRIQIGPLDV